MDKDPASYHIPVLLKECIENLKIKPNGIYVDVTYGGGGHSKAILEHLGPEGSLIAFDQDPDVEANIIKDERLIFVNSNFRFLKRYLKLHGITEVDGILADIGVSSHQLDKAKRGFSYSSKEFLDMRMQPGTSLTAADILNRYDPQQLLNVFSTYGEIRNAKTLTEAVVQSRSLRKYKVVPDLVATLDAVMIGDKYKYMAQVFQALRIEVNDELGALKDLLQQGKEVLKPGGRFVVMSFHSLEDRLVKNYFKSGNFSGEHEKDFYGHIEKFFTIINKKPIEPTREELKQNPRSGSVKLRVVEKI
ncbi:MAG TPA: 16S rRNA (cytosine(1402)-N(4))-methyltransferase RsmH [Saprospiraceae bacterium]|nr:16S rRNA (cytosine(1402)-N(4))-methyltransferase RsmH [Saprospiraceae bacterium]